MRKRACEILSRYNKKPTAEKLNMVFHVSAKTWCSKAKRMDLLSQGTKRARKRYIDIPSKIKPKLIDCNSK